MISVAAGAGNKQNDYLAFEVTQGHSLFHKTSRIPQFNKKNLSNTHTTKALSYQSSSVGREKNPKTNYCECEINGKFVVERAGKKIGREFFLFKSQTIAIRNRLINEK